MKKYTIATVVKVKNGHVWAERMEEGIKKFGRETGHNTFLVGPPKADENLQMHVLDDLIAQKVDALCVVPLFPEAIEWSLRKAQKDGIIVIANEAPNQRNVHYNVEAFDNTAFGIHMLDQLAAYMGKAGQYAVFLESLTAKSQNEWACSAVTRQHEQYPDMALVTRKIEHHDDRVLVAEKAKNLLTQYPGLKGILALGETAAHVIGSMLEEKGVYQKIVLVGTGLLLKEKRRLLKTAIKSIGLWDPADSAYVMNKLAAMVLNGESITNGMDFGVPGYNHIKLDGKLIVGSAMIDMTKENMDRYNF